jgi:hypothetical protein
MYACMYMCALSFCLLLINKYLNEIISNIFTRLITWNIYTKCNANTVQDAFSRLLECGSNETHYGK